MSDYEIIGRAAILLGMAFIIIGTIGTIQWIAWIVFKEIVGWPRIFKALRLLRDTESREQKLEPLDPGCQCEACKVVKHASDCSVHNEPAHPNGPCDCRAVADLCGPAAFERNNRAPTPGVG